MCTTCYKKLAWQPKLKICKRCNRELPHHAKGFCAGCYNTLFNLDKAKAYNYKKWHNLDLETYKKITQKCFVCDYEDIVDLHHLDGNKENNSKENLIGLCPNDHRKIHNYKFKDQIFERINKKRSDQGLTPLEKQDIFIQNNPRK